MNKRMSLALALLCAAPIVLAGAGMDIGPGGGGGGGGSGDVTAASSLTDNAFVVGDGGSKGVKTISASTARSTLNVEDGAAADQAASEFEAGGATPLTLENIPGSASTGDFWVGAASGRATPVSSSTAGAGLANLVNPADHAASHTDGTDDIQSATNAQKGLATAAHITALEALAGAEANPGVVSQAEAEAGTSTAERTWTPQRVKQAIDALAGGGASPALLVGTWVEYTISAGAINVTSGVHFVHIDTESDAAADDLDTIQVGGGAPAGAYVVFINAENDARTVDVTSSGNIDPSGAGTSDASSVSLNTDQRSMLLIYDPDQSQWETYGVQF